MNRTLTEITLDLHHGRRPFYYRSDSVGDLGVIEQIFKNHDYDLTRFAQYPSLMAHYDALIRSGDKPLIIDAGANIGASVVYFSDHFPGSKLLAIEPEKNNFNILKKNCHGLNFVALEGGIGYEDGSMYLLDPGQSDWGFQLQDHGDYKVSVFGADETIRDQVKQGLTPFIFKIDIEGGEENLFRENTGWLATFPLIVIELHDWLFPGKSNSRNFLRAISALNFDFVYVGENAFCFNNDLLSQPA